MHLTESCDEELPHLITDIHTTAATATDVKQLSAIQEGLAQRGLLPAEQLADSSYVCGSNLVFSHARQIDLIGPAFKDNTWQAEASEGFDVASFSIDWEGKMDLKPVFRSGLSAWPPARFCRPSS